MKLTAVKHDASGIWHIPELEHWVITFHQMVTNLEKGRHFKFARYGDGEIYCMNGRSGANCDNHPYFPDLGSALRQTITEEPAYMVGVQPLSISHIPQDVTSYFGHFKRLYNADVLHNASIEGRIMMFMDALAGKYVILVGPAHLSGLFTNCIHIITPSVSCWLQYKQISEQLHFHLEGSSDAIVILCASMMSEVIISDFESTPHTFIDAGSVFDPYAGVNSRKYHSKLRR